MKFIYLVPVLGLAAIAGAAQQSLVGSDPVVIAPAAPSVPPWLTEQWTGEAEAHATLGQADPHGALGGSDPHAEICANIIDDSDPHAALCAGAGAPAGHEHEHGADPHAGMHAGAAHAGDPHAGVYGAGDPHVGAGDPHSGAAPAAAAPVARSAAKNGRTVAEVFADRAALEQKSVRVRGTVVKLTEGVLGKTYLHLQDGTGNAEAGNHDLTVTTTQAFELGETVEVEGQIAIDQDVGVGYQYAALLANAVRVTPEG